MGKSRFQNHWLERPEFVGWLRRDSKDVFRAYCNVCQRSFDVKNMGEGAVKSHAGGTKHIANMKQSSSAGSASSFFSPPARRVENERSTVSGNLKGINFVRIFLVAQSVKLFNITVNVNIIELIQSQVKYIKYIIRMTQKCKHLLPLWPIVFTSDYFAINI